MICDSWRPSGKVNYAQSVPVTPKIGTDLFQVVSEEAGVSPNRHAEGKGGKNLPITAWYWYSLFPTSQGFPGDYTTLHTCGPYPKRLPVNKTRAAPWSRSNCQAAGQNTNLSPN